MGRTERLWQTIDLLSRRRSVSMKELCRRFGVSERTIYRDMRSLTKMKVTVEFDGGYRLSESTRTRGFLSAEQVELAVYCLRHNPLVEYPFFRTRLRKIERCLRPCIGKPEDRGSRLEHFVMAARGDDRTRERPECDQWLRLFLAACAMRGPVTVSTAASPDTPVRYRPLNVLLTYSGPLLCVETREGKRLDIPLSDVIDLKLSD